MKIYGIGTDIISVDRIKKSMRSKIFLIEFLVMKKLQNVINYLIQIIVMQKDLQPKKLLLKLLTLAYPTE